MRRGFKTSCERSAARYRHELGLSLDEPLDPEALASHIGVTVWRPEEVPGLTPESLAQLTRHDSDSWSAVTIHSPEARVTIVNSAHPPTRQRSSVAHELAHLLLDHEPDRIDVSTEGLLILSSFERTQEDEANWFAGTLLVPRDGLVRAYRTSRGPRDLATRFRVSPSLLNWRLQATGVALQMRRAYRYRRARRR